MKKVSIFYLGVVLSSFVSMQTHANTMMAKEDLYKALSDTSMIDQASLEIETKCLGISKEFYLSAFKKALDNCWSYVPDQVDLEKPEDLEAMANCMSNETYTQLDVSEKLIDKCLSE